jgi:hypothetical protein
MWHSSRIVLICLSKRDWLINHLSSHHTKTPSGNQPDPNRSLIIYNTSKLRTDMMNTPRGLKEGQARACDDYRGSPTRNHKTAGGNQTKTKLSMTYERNVPSRRPDQQNMRMPGCSHPITKLLHIHKHASTIINIHPLL